MDATFHLEVFRASGMTEYYFTTGDVLWPVIFVGMIGTCFIVAWKWKTRAG